MYMVMISLQLLDEVGDVDMFDGAEGGVKTPPPPSPPATPPPPDLPPPNPTRRCVCCHGIGYFRGVCIS